MEITTQVQFQEKMQERIRAGIGDLMPDETLKEIVRRGVEDAFFKCRPEVRNTWGNVQQPEVKSWLVRFIEAEMKPQVEAAAREWIAANQDKVQALLREKINEGVAACVLQAFAKLMDQPLDQFREAVATKFGELARSTNY